MKLAVLKCPIAVHHGGGLPPLDPTAVAFNEWIQTHPQAELPGPPQIMHFPQHHDHVFMYLFYYERPVVERREPEHGLTDEEVQKLKDSAPANQSGKTVVGRGAVGSGKEQKPIIPVE